ncbi:MAG TPA: hypothetical protein EYG80_04605 [Flavobacteriaceae bacterium]|nr:hypothetical protein [Flavobacteriaceae bacterium]
MSKIDTQLIKLLKSKSNKNISFIDEIALALEINYDAAYRRVNGKTTISLEEAVKLSKYFNISLNKLFTIDDDSKILIRQTLEIKNIKTLELYFNIVYKRLKPMINNDKGKMYYSAKELPIFHLLYNTKLLRFKLYVWLQVLGHDNNSKKVAFENFHIPESLIDTVLDVGNLYRNVKITEIWSSNIINTVLHQIQYFFESSLLSHKSAITICEDLMSTIKNIEETAYYGKRDELNKTSYQLFYNPLLNSNNNVLIKLPNYKVLFMSYSILRYYEIEDIGVCNNMEQFLKNQILLSKQVTNSGTKDIILFFKPLYRQIDGLVKQINLLKQFPIQKY